MPEKPDAFAMAERPGALDELIEQGVPALARITRGGPKAGWRGTNIRMAPEVKRRLKALGRRLGVPIEEFVHLALLRYLDGLENGEIEPDVREAVTRRTVL